MLHCFPLQEGGLAPQQPEDEDDIGDLETGVAQWRARGLPAEQGAKSARWGASYGLQFRILFIRRGSPHFCWPLGSGCVLCAYII
jgi:hypothetical protein